MSSNPNQRQTSESSSSTSSTSTSPLTSTSIPSPSFNPPSSGNQNQPDNLNSNSNLNIPLTDSSASVSSTPATSSNPYSHLAPAPTSTSTSTHQYASSTPNLTYGSSSQQSSSFPVSPSPSEIERDSGNGGAGGSVNHGLGFGTAFGVGSEEGGIRPSSHSHSHSQSSQHHNHHHHHHHQNLPSNQATMEGRKSPGGRMLDRMGMVSVTIGGGGTGGGASGSRSRGSSSGSVGKGKGRDYGDRFIPQRSSTDLAASYNLLEPSFSPLAGTDGQNGANGSGANGRDRKRVGVGGEMDALRDEANRAFTHLLKAELFSSSATSSTDHPLASPTSSSRPMGPFHSNSTPNLPLRSPSYQPTQSPIPHNHHPAGHGFGVNALPPLPSHVPSTPTSSGGGSGAFGSGSSRNSSHHKHSAAAAAAAAGGGVGGIGSPTGQSSSHLSGTPTTPTRKRLFTFASPTATRTSSPSGTPGGRQSLIPASPGNFSANTILAGGYGLGPGVGGVGGGLDDMLHEKYSLSPVGRESQRALLSPRKAVRWLAKTPFKVLDAPELADDFYLNLVSWSSTNVLGVGLNSCVYLWSAHTSKVTKLCDLSTNPGSTDGSADVATGLEWTNRGSTIAVGTTKGKVEIWDAEKCKKIRTMSGHTGRVGCLAWNEHLLSTGSRDRSIFHRDVRVPEHFIRELKGHRQEVCGLRWNTSTDQLASGGNDNKLFVWEKTNELPLYRFSEHQAAVKAIAWSPHQRGLLASGGGTADKKLRFWNGLTGNMLSEWDTGAQICNLMWSKNSNELVSTHGYSGGQICNQICIWRYPTMTQVSTLTGHTHRVLYLAMSPDGQTIVTGAGDETLRFWNAFQKKKIGDGKDEAGFMGPSRREDGLNPFMKIR